MIQKGGKDRAKEMGMVGERRKKGRKKGTEETEGEGREGRPAIRNCSENHEVSRINLTENVLRLLQIKLQIIIEEHKRRPETSKEIPCSGIRRQHHKDVHFPQTKLNLQCKYN